MADKDYSGTPLPAKLGIKEGHRVAFPGEPGGFRRALGRLADGVAILTRVRGGMDVVVLFVTQTTDLRRRFGVLAAKLDPAGGLWVAWPKKAAAMDTDLSFEGVQSIGLKAGLVDNKSCSIDDTWQALRFVYRLRDRG